MTKITAYKSASGSVYENREQAVTDEMDHHLTVVLDEASIPAHVRDQVVELLIKQRSRITSILSIDGPEVRCA